MCKAGGILRMSSNYFVEIPLGGNKLISLIKDDKEKFGIYYGRYPVRFILIDNFEDMKKIIETMAKNGVETLDLSSLENFQDSNGWISAYELIDVIKKLPEEKDYIVFPISEILRFLDNDDFYSLLTSLMEIENSTFNSKRRIYIPILGLLSRFRDSFLNRYHRKSEFSFVWKIGNGHEKYNLIFCKFASGIEGFTVVHTTKDFLDLWKKDSISPSILISSELLCYLSNRAIDDELFTLTKIKDAKEYIEKILTIDIPIEYKESEDSLWRILLENIKGVNSFEELVKRHLNVIYLDDLVRVNPLSLWLDTNESFTRWIIKAYYSTINKNCYTKTVFNSLSSLSTEEAIRGYYLKIFDEKFNKNFLEERRTILQNALKDRNLDLRFIENELEEKISSMPLEEAVNYITNTTFFEKKWIIENIAHIDKRDLETIYPELYFYREDVTYKDLSPENTWIDEYFKEYRASRIENSISPRLVEILEERNANEESFFKWYYSFEPVINYIEDNEYTKIWIDALGVEFLPLLISLLSQEGFKVDFNIGRVNLPSTTGFNTFEGVERVSDLDDFIHNQYSYFYPDNLIREIDIIKSIVDKIIKTKESVLIFSDHGFTAFANTKFDGKKILGLKFAEREGRYAEITDEKNMPVEDEDFFVYPSEEGKKYLITSKHKFFSETSCRETHGGATPEEVLVPVIYASKVEKRVIKEEYKIELLTKEINIRTPILELKIKPDPEKVSFLVKNRDLNADFDRDKEIYKINLSGYKAGEYTLTVKIGLWTKDLEFKIRGGLRERDIFS